MELFLRTPSSANPLEYAAPSHEAEKVPGRDNVTITTSHLKFSVRDRKSVGNAGRQGRIGLT